MAKGRQPIINNVFSKCYCNHSIDQENILRHIATLFAWKAQSHSVPPPILTSKDDWQTTIGINAVGESTEKTAFGEHIPLHLLE